MTLRIWLDYSIHDSGLLLILDNLVLPVEPDWLFFLYIPDNYHVHVTEICWEKYYYTVTTPACSLVTYIPVISVSCYLTCYTPVIPVP